MMQQQIRTCRDPLPKVKIDRLHLNRESDASCKSRQFLTFERKQSPTWQK